MADISKIQVGDTTYNLRDRNYCTCSTSAAVAEKTATLDGFVLTAGSCVIVNFTNGNTASSPLLNINSTGAKEIYRDVATPAGENARTSWADNSIVTFLYDGTHFVIVKTGDASESAMTTVNIPVNTDLDTVRTPGVYRVWGAYTNGPDIGNMYGSFFVVGGGPVQVYFGATASSSFYRGYANAHWYNWQQLMQSSGGTFDGLVSIDQADGTTSTQGWSQLRLGNDKTTGTAGNSAGFIRMYGTTQYKVDLYPVEGLSAHRDIKLPNANGTIALNENTFKYKGALASGADLNSLIGVDNVGAWLIQDSATNSPGVSWCTLYNNVPDYGQQMIVTGSYLYTRTRSGSPRQWGAWYVYNSNPITNYHSTVLTITRVDNSFANAESIARLHAYRKGGMLWCDFNLAITGGGTFSNFVQIGTISGWSAISTTYFNIPGQNVATQTLSAYISYNGGIFIYSAQTITSQFFRASVSAPAVY